MDTNGEVQCESTEETKAAVPSTPPDRAQLPYGVALVAMRWEQEELNQALLEARRCAEAQLHRQAAITLAEHPEMTHQVLALLEKGTMLIRQSHREVIERFERSYLHRRSTPHEGRPESPVGKE